MSFQWITEAQRRKMDEDDRMVSEAIADAYRRLLIKPTKTDSEFIIPASDRKRLYALL